MPNDTDLVNIYGIDVKTVYSDGTTKDIIPNYENQLSYNYSFDYVSTNTENGKQYAKYKVTYKEFSTEFKVELIDVGDIAYPIQLMATYEGETIKKGTTPRVDDIATSVVCSDMSYTVADSSKLRFVLFYDYGVEEKNIYEYIVVYDYTFNDANGNELYVCTWRTMDVPYE